jgi:hypothetical protein
MTDREDTQTEEYQVAGEGLLAKIKELIRQGNIRRIMIRNDQGQTLIEIPLTWGWWRRSTSPRTIDGPGGPP